MFLEQGGLAQMAGWKTQNSEKENNRSISLITRFCKWGISSSGRARALRMREVAGSTPASSKLFSVFLLKIFLHFPAYFQKTLISKKTSHWNLYSSEIYL